MSVRIGHASIDERGDIAGGAAGDQTGAEVCTRSWYAKGWNKVLRPKSSTVAEKMAVAMEQACANNHIGYDQNQRTTLYTYAKAAGWNLSRITTNCECDCSSLIAVCVNAAGVQVSKDIYTGNESAALMATGQFELLTASKYLNSDSCLKRGDVLLKEGYHTAMVLSNGANAGGSTPTPDSSAWKATGTATCADNSVNVRATPGGAVIGQLGKGNRFEIDGAKSGEWIHIKVAGIGIGYMHKDYVKYDSPQSAPAENWKATGTATSLYDHVNVRATPGMNGKVLGEVNTGNRFEVDGQKSGEWVHVKVANNIGIGYIHECNVRYDR